MTLEQIEKILNDEISRCEQLIEKHRGHRSSGKTLIALISLDIHSAKKAIENRSESDMFRSLITLKTKQLIKLKLTQGIMTTLLFIIIIAL